MLRAGDTFDHYRIEAAIGEGGMGTVYRAFDVRLQRRVALKVLRRARLVSESERDDDARIDEAKARMMREARAAAALQHPNAVAIYDVGEVDGVPYLAMELVSGTSLRAYVGNAAVPLSRIVRWLADVARALDAAHRAGLIHRDVKPDNVMVAEDGAVKVLDFGIARGVRTPVDPQANTAADAALGTITGHGGEVGTPMYMAPEQLRGDSLDGRVDQFAWGVMAYELVTGASPWRASGPLGVAAAIVTAEPEPPSKRRAEAAGALEATILRALRKSPDARFPVMSDVVAALERVAMPTVSSPPPVIHSQVEATTRRVRRLPSARTLALFVGSVSLMLALGATARRARTRVTTSQATSAAIDAPVIDPKRPMAIVDQPMPTTSVAAAQVAYADALQAIREGSGARSVGALERALTLDPHFAPARFRLVEAAVLMRRADTVGRDEYRLADEARSGLGARDRELLDALEPIVRRQPSDYATADARVAAMIARAPGDAELWYLHGLFASDRGDLAHAVEHFAEATRLDPKFSLAHGNRAEMLAYLGRFDDARAALASCLDATPTAMGCLDTEARVATQTGDCGRLEAIAQRLATSDAMFGTSREYLADALASPRKSVSGALLRPSIAAAREALKLRVPMLPEEDRAATALSDRAKLAALEGDFVESEGALREQLRLAEGGRRAAEHARPSRDLALVLMESGRPLDAAQVAEDFFARRAAWAADPRAEDFAIGDDATWALLSAEQASGALTLDRLDARREDAVTAWRARVSGEFVPFLWVHAYAGVAAHVQLAAEARTALDAQSRFGAIPAFRDRTLAEAWIGESHRLVGEIEPAIDWLERATSTCRALELPIDHTRAFLWLGRAREAKGDGKGACEAYRVVLERWGHARPRSISADEARGRTNALGCARAR
ncbi:MAG: protein kinase [Polyangiales bacterium]